MARVVMFSSARRASGCAETTTPGATINEVLAALVARFGSDFAAVLPSCSVALDATVVPDPEWADHRLTDSSEIAILPPSSGG